MVNYTIEWLGTGSGLNPELGVTSFLLTGESSRTLLVDCGRTTYDTLYKIGKLGQVTDVLVTHAHNDHVGSLEALAQHSYFIFKKQPHLWLPTEEFRNELWEHTLQGGIDTISDDVGQPKMMGLDDYFAIGIGLEINISGLPKIVFLPRKHVPAKENYGLQIGTSTYYSGDTWELPPNDPTIARIFQDCQFFESGPRDVHCPLAKLKEMDENTKRKTYLVHLGNGHKNQDPKTDGFAGFVLPGQKFEIKE